MDLSKAYVGTAGKPYDEPSKADRFETIRTYFKILIEEEMPDCNAA